MATTITEIEDILGANALVADVGQLRMGHIRIQTNLLYPDGSAIDVFLEQDAGRLDIAHPKLTDFGNTWSWLQNLEIRADKSPTNQMHFERILKIYGCTQSGAAIEQEISDLDQLPVSIVRLGQACLRTADLIYSKRFRVQNNFNVEFADLLAEVAPHYEVGGEIPLRSGNIVKLDFTVRGMRRQSAVFTLSSGDKQTAHNKATDIHAKWTDIADLSEWLNEGNLCVTVLDDEKTVYDEGDLDRLRRKSTLIPVSNPEELSTVLEAA